MSYTYQNDISNLTNDEKSRIGNEKKKIERQRRTIDHVNKQRLREQCIREYEMKDCLRNGISFSDYSAEFKLRIENDIRSRIGNEKKKTAREKRTAIHKERQRLAEIRRERISDF